MSTGGYIQIYLDVFLLSSILMDCRLSVGGATQSRPNEVQFRIPAEEKNDPPNASLCSAANIYSTAILHMS